MNDLKELLKDVDLRVLDMAKVPVLVVKCGRNYTYDDFKRVVEAFESFREALPEKTNVLFVPRNVELLDDVSRIRHYIRLLESQLQKFCLPDDEKSKTKKTSVGSGDTINTRGSASFE